MTLRDRYPYYLANHATWGTELLGVVDKYDGKIATRVALAGPEAIEAAIAAASKAEPAMRAMPPWQRKEVLDHVVRRVRERQEELALALCIEAGKPIRDARGEVARLIDTFQVAAEESVRIDGEVMNLEISKRATGYRGFTRRVPVGAVSLITPFNFPLNLVAHKVAPAIAAGCPFVLKPSDRTPASALVLGEILAETSLPEGAFSVLTSKLEHVGPFIEDPRLKLLSFTGSAKVGWELKARAGKKKVTLELGGNAACIVDRDQGERIEHVVERLVFGAFYQSGQSCISVQRILVHASLQARLRDALVAKVRSLKAGDPKDEATVLGPLIDEASAKRLERWIERVKDRGGTVLCGGTRKGSFLDATVLEGVPHDEPLYDEEAFGPVVLLEPFEDFDRALETVNASRYGLQTGIFTNDLAHAFQAWDTLDVGGVVVGDVPSFRVDNMPYGGVKESGLGREGVRAAIEDMTEVRLMVLKT